jgi:O-antigen ligase
MMEPVRHGRSYSSPLARSPSRRGDLVISVVLGLILFVSVLDFSRFGFDSDSARAANSLLKMLVAATAAAVAWTFRSRVGGTTMRLAAPLLVYVAVAGLSAAWTVDMRATVIGIAGLIAFTSVALLTASLPLESVLRAIRIACDTVVGLSVLLYLMSPTLATVYLQGTDRLAGITFGPHAVARCAAVSFLIRAHMLRRDRSVLKLVLFCAWGTLYSLTTVLADSRQVYFVSGIGIAVLFLPRRRGHAVLYGGALLVFAALAFVGLKAAGYEIIDSAITMLARASGEDVASLTGRTSIWQASGELVLSSPWLGNGFNAGGIVLSSAYATLSGWTTASAHNVVLHALLDVGVLGAGLLVFIMLTALHRANASGERIGIAIIASIVALGFVERSIAGSAGFLFLLFAIVYVRAPNPPSGRGVQRTRGRMPATAGNSWPARPASPREG